MDTKTISELLLIVYWIILTSINFHTTISFIRSKNDWLATIAFGITLLSLVMLFVNVSRVMQ
jgi:hypothetical protein